MTKIYNDIEDTSDISKVYCKNVYHDINIISYRPAPQTLCYVLIICVKF